MVSVAAFGRVPDGERLDFSVGGLNNRGGILVCWNWRATPALHQQSEVLDREVGHDESDGRG